MTHCSMHVMQHLLATLLDIKIFKAAQKQRKMVVVLAPCTLRQTYQAGACKPVAQLPTGRCNKVCTLLEIHSHNDRYVHATFGRFRSRQLGLIFSEAPGIGDRHSQAMVSCAEPSASQDCEIQFCDDHTQHEFSLTMLGQQCENGEQQPNDAALQHDHDLDIEFFTEKDLQHPSQSEAGHAQMSCSSARGGGGATRQSNCPLGRTPVGFEEVDAASLAALLGQEASTMCDIVFCDEDSASPAGAGTLFPRN